MLDQLERLPFIVVTLMVEKMVTSGSILKSTLETYRRFLGWEQVDVSFGMKWKSINFVS